MEIHGININSVKNYKDDDSVKLCGYISQILYAKNSVPTYKFTVDGCVNL